MRKILLIVVWLTLLTGLAQAQRTCTRVTATSQNCLATVSWTASVVDATHSAPNNYLIRRGDAGGAMTQIGSVAATSTSFQNTFTDAGNVAHCWEVVAVALPALTSPPSTQACWTTPAIAAVAPNAPQGITIASVSSSTLRVTWEDTDGEIGYELEGKAAKGNAAFIKVASLPADTATYDWISRKRFTSYCVRLRGLFAGPSIDYPTTPTPYSETRCGTTSK